MANFFDQFDTPTKGAKAPDSQPAKKQNFFDQFDNETPATPAPVENSNTPAAAATTPTYGNGTGVVGVVTGVGRGVAGLPEKAESAWNAIKGFGEKLVNAPHEIAEQARTGTLTTPEFQAATPLGKAESLAGGAATGAAETGRAIAQLPNQLANTAVAIGNSVAPETITRDTSKNPVDIYGRDTFGTDNAVSTALQPQTEQGKAITAIAPYLTGGGLLAETGKVYAMSVKSLQDRGIPLTSENIAQEVTQNMALLGLGVGATKGASAIAGVTGEVIPAAVTGKASLRTTAGALGEEGSARLYQGGNTEAQGVYKAGVSDEAGNVTGANVFTGESAESINAARQRREGGYEAQQAAGNEAAVGATQRNVEAVNGENAGTAQEAVGKATDEFIHVKNREYHQGLAEIQDALDSRAVPVTELHMKKTKEMADHYLSQKANKFSKLQPRTIQFMKDVKEAKFENIHDIDDLKRSISEEMQHHYAQQNGKDYNALSQLKERLKLERNATIRKLVPQVSNTLDATDRLFADYVDPLGTKSKAAKIAGQGNEELAARSLVGGSSSARGNAADISGTLRQMRADQRFENGANIAEGFSEGMGATARDFAHEQAEIAAQNAANATNARPGDYNRAYLDKFNQILSNSQPAMMEVTGLGARNQSQINQAMMNAVQSTQAQIIKPSSIPGEIAHFASHKIPIAGPRLIEPVVNAINKGVDWVSLRAMRDQALRNRVASATPEEIETMYRMNQNTPEAVATPYASMVAGNAPQPSQNGTGSDNGMITITLPPEEPETPTEPQQHAQTAHKETVPETDHGTTTFYRAVAHAETGGLSNRFIFTKAHDKSTTQKSSAYGPAQLTTRTARDFYKQHPDLFTPEERDYLDRFIEQGTRMLHSDDHDSTYGYGAPGVLGGAEDRKLYFRVVHKMMGYMIKKNGGSYEKTIREWRYGSPNADINKRDPAYAKKVRSYFIQNL